MTGCRQERADVGACDSDQQRERQLKTQHSCFLVTKTETHCILYCPKCYLACVFSQEVLQVAKIWYIPNAIQEPSQSLPMNDMTALIHLLLFTEDRRTHIFSSNPNAYDNQWDGGTLFYYYAALGCLILLWLYYIYCLYYIPLTGSGGPFCHPSQFSWRFLKKSSYGTMRPLLLMRTLRVSCSFSSRSCSSREPATLVT